MRMTRRGKRRVTVLVLLAVVGVAGAFTFRTVRTQQQERLTEEARASGLAAYAAGDYEGTLASDALPYVVQHDRNDVEVLMAFADARARLPLPGNRHITEAVSYNKRALSLLQADDPDHEQYRAEAQDRLLELYSARGLHVEVIGIADQILEADPGHAEAHAAKAGALLAQRDFDAAESSARTLIRLQPDVFDWRSLLVDIHHLRGDEPGHILDLCAAWHTDNPPDGRYLALQAAYLSRLGRYEEARALLPAVAEAGAATREVLERTAALLDGLGRRDLASDLMGSAKAEFGAAAWVVDSLIDRAWYAGHIDDALAVYADLPRSSLDTPRLRRLAELHLAAAARSDVLRDLADLERHADATDADRAWAEGLRARLNTSLTYAERISIYDRAAAVNAEDATMAFFTAEEHLAAGEQSQAIRSFARAREFAPYWLAASSAYAEALLDAGRVDAAYDIAQDVLRRAPQRQIDAWVLFARAHLAMLRSGARPGGVEESVDLAAMLEQMRRLAPDDPRIVPLLIEAYVHEGDRPAAQRLVEQTVARRDVSPHLLAAVARCCTEYGLDRGDAIIRRMEGGAAARIDALLSSGDARAALDVLNEALVQNPSDEQILQRQLGVQVAAGVPFGEMATAARAALARFPQRVEPARRILAYPELWKDRALIDEAIKRLTQLLGGDAQQVRLAEANVLLKYSPDDEAAAARALMIVSEVLEASPDSLPALVLMAEASLRSSNRSVDRAIEQLERAVGLYPGMPELSLRLADLLQERGEFERARQYLSRLSTVSGASDELRQVEVTLLARQGDFERALARAAMDDGRSDVMAQLQRAAIAARAGETDRARAAYDELAAAHSDDPTVIEAVAAHDAVDGHLGRGIDRLGAVYDHLPPNEIAARQALFCIRYGAIEDAERLLQDAAASRDAGPLIHEARARIALAQRDLTAARSHAAAGLRQHRDHAPLGLVYVVSMLLDPDADRDLIYEAISALELDHPPLLDLLGLYAAVDVVENLSAPNDVDLRRARELVDEHDDFLPMWMMAISLHLDGERVDTAVDLAQRAVRRFPASAEAAGWATRVLMHAHRWQDALREAAEWRRRARQNPREPDAAIATIMLQLARPNDAIAQLEPHVDAFMAEKPDPAGDRGLWLRALLRSGRVAAAWRVAESLVSGRGDQVATWRAIWLQENAMMPPEAAMEALQVLGDDTDRPGSQRVAVALAWTRLAERHRRAVDHAEQVAAGLVETEIHATTGLMLLGCLDEMQRQWSQAAVHYRDVLDLHPESALAMNNLAAVLTRVDGNADEAVAVAARAVKFEPQNADFLDTYANALAAVERYDDAAAMMLQASQLRPDNQEMMLRLAELQYESDRSADARRTLETVGAAIENAAVPDPEQVRRVRRLRVRLAEGTEQQSSEAAAANGR